MRIFFFSKNRIMLRFSYLMAGLLLLAAASFFLPFSADSQPATAEVGESGDPYRCGDPESELLSLAINVDWGEEYLPDLLAVLQQYQAPVTFFVTGRWCNNNPELVKAMAEAGHELGNHGYSHSSPNASSVAEIVDEITRTEQAIREAAGVTTRLYAPPSGESEPHVIQAATDMGYHTILWSVDTIDWQKPDAATIVQRVMDKVGGGAIILAHPTASTVEALPQILQQLQEEGYRFVTVSENLGL